MRNRISHKRIAVILFSGVMLLILSGFAGCLKSTSNPPPYNQDLALQDTTAADIEPAAVPVPQWPFSLKEDQQLAEDLEAKNYYIIFDGSGSMGDNGKIEIAKEAFKEFVAYIPAGANVGLYAFDQGGKNERVAMGHDRGAVLNQLERIRASGTTPLKDALEFAYRQLTAQGQKQLGYGEYNMVIITDGEASDGQEPGKIVDTILTDSPVVIHTIGFQIGPSHSLNQPGRIYYKQADNLEELSSGLEEVLAELDDFSPTDFRE